MAYGENSSAPAGAEGGAPARRSFFKRRKTCPFSGPHSPAIDWKDVKLLGRYISERGKMMPSRITAVSTAKQKKLAQAIKRARYMALLAPVRVEMERDGSGRPPRGEGEGGYRPRYDRGDRGDRNDRGDRSEQRNESERG